MESRFCIFLLILALLTSTQSALADSSLVVEPEVERRDIQETGIDSENFELGVYFGLLSVEDFGANTVLGYRAAFHISEDFFLEGAYGQSETSPTSSEPPYGPFKLLTDSQRTLTYYNLSFGWNLLPGEAFIGSGRAFNHALYLIGGVGSTNFADTDYFTVNFGFGYRLLLTDWLALHLDVRDHMFEHELLGEMKSTHNLEMHSGLTIFF